ncbi:hypothetical protein ISR1_0133 [Streptococcus pyogenes]|nr:putative membrane protein [Streptococcus pyogenes AA472]KGE60363.1 putative membrane protein [Streptococcus pyogenes SS1447]KGE61194.1 putative membrane protein [Streptococcus pyogenes MGAS2111]SDV80028.1 hypothetical protein ISR1_0133 [Streptococcus pyogenes]SDV90528.1 hypothetical protein ISR2_0537 [Streptococcus pyogenes]
MELTLTKSIGAYIIIPRLILLGSNVLFVRLIMLVTIAMTS